mmetsp:Transcript_51493/g.96481  ORF Transcript_51493/g.96481 Transcript_51493/m.96481 type:complete len:666 (+) Transcript_51493:92-2089(+)
MSEAATLLSYVEELLTKASKEEDKSGTLGEAAKSATDALESYKSAGDAKGEAKAMSALAKVSAADGKPKDGIAMAEKASVIFEEVGEPAMMAKELSTMSKLYLEVENPRKALYYAQEALELMMDAGTSSGEQVELLSLVVKAYIAKNQVAAALDEANSALSRFSGDAKAEAEANSILFDAYFASGNVEEALIALEAAISGYKAVGDVAKESTLLSTSSKLALQEGDYEKSGSQAVRAMELAKAAENWSEMLSALECCVKAALASSDGKTAVNSAIEAREVFEKAGLQKMEASACLLLCDAHLANKKFDRAATAAKAAQEISYALEDEKGEATALDAMATVHMMEGTRFDKAARAAEQARRLWKGLESSLQECNALNVIAQSQFNQQMEKEKSGARTGPNDWDKSFKAGTEALKIARELPDDNAPILVGNALCVLCEIHIAKKEGKEAMTMCNEAVGLFLDSNEEAAAAYAWLLCAQAAILLEDYHQAQEDAGEGLTLYQGLKDEGGEAFAKQIIDLVEQLAPPPPPQFALPPGWENMMAGGAMPMPSAMKMPVAAAGPAPEAAPAAGGGAVARTGGGSGKLSLSGGVSKDTVSKKIQEVAMGIIGDGEPIEEDTPLMQAGLTSNTAVLLRDELSGDIPGVSFPPTLIFDYPSIGAIAEYVMEKAG